MTMTRHADSSNHTAPAAQRAPVCRRTIRTSLLCLMLPVLLGACSTTDSDARLARQNEETLYRRQAEDERPKIDNQKVYLDTIREMQERSLYFASLAHIDAYLKVYDNTPEVARLRADALRATGQPEAAQAQYRALLTSTQAAGAWHGLGLLAGQRGDYATAITDFRAAIACEPTNAVVLSDLGYALMQSGDLPGARLPLMQAIELMPENRKIISNLVLYLLLSKERKKAEGMMTQAGFTADVKAEIVRQAIRLGATDLPASLGHVGPPAAAPPGKATARRDDKGTRQHNDASEKRSDETLMQTMLQRFATSH